MNIGDIVISKQGGDRCLVVNTFGLESVVLRSLEYTSLGDFVAPISALEVVKPENQENIKRLRKKLLENK